MSDAEPNFVQPQPDRVPEGDVSPPGPGTVLDAGDSAPGPSALSPPVDRLAHRRAEPRLFTFFWTLYLLLTVAGSILWMTRSSVLSASSYGPAARVMLVVIAAGATLLWPMVRLSQLPPRVTARAGILSACFVDVIVVAAPIQTIIWPMAIVAGWPVDVVGALALMFVLWPALVGAVLAALFAAERRAGRDSGDHPVIPAARSACMVLIVCLTTAAPVVLLIAAALGNTAIPTGRPWAATWLAAASPFTLVHAITGVGLSGPPAPVPLLHWYTLGGLSLAAALTWVVAASLASAGPRPADR